MNAFYLSKYLSYDKGYTSEEVHKWVGETQMSNNNNRFS